MWIAPRHDGCLWLYTIRLHGTFSTIFDSRNHLSHPPRWESDFGFEVRSATASLTAEAGNYGETMCEDEDSHKTSHFVS